MGIRTLRELLLSRAILAVVPAALVFLALLALLAAYLFVTAFSLVVPA